jgi:hypothetical protein
MPNLVTGLFYFLLSLLVYKQLLMRWIRNLARRPHGRDSMIGRAGGDELGDTTQCDSGAAVRESCAEVKGVTPAVRQG